MTSPARYLTALRRAFAAAISLGIATLIYPGESQADFHGSWFNNKRELTLTERRAQRKQFQAAFAEKFGPEYETNIPFASQQAIDGLNQAIARYRNIVAGGGWRPFSGKGTIRLNDYGKHVYELRRHLALTGDLRVESRR